MAVRVIIDRKIKKGKKDDFSQLLKEMRTKAMEAKGYISGETLRAFDDPNNYLVISTWHSIDDWKNWEKSPDRKEIERKIEKIVARPTKVKILVNV